MYYLQIEQYKAEIKKLQASEAEIKALSVNYAALLKEKEVRSLLSGIYVNNLYLICRFLFSSVRLKLHNFALGVC